jgi:lipopolysaccharide biosynthesis glycosyltransferase
MQDLVRVYVGTDRSQLLAVAVLEHSIRRHTRRPVQVCPLIDLDLPEPKDVRQGSRTNFSFARFAIPELAGYEGRAIYLDADMLVFRDIGELWDTPLEGAAVAIQESIPDHAVAHAKAGAPAKRVKQCSVMLIDCARAGWDVHEIVGGLDGRYTYEELMYELCILPESEIRYTVPFSWNSLEHFDPETRLIHYTDMDTQPWVSAVNRNGPHWLEEVRLMLDTGALTGTELKTEIDLGYFRPSLLAELEEMPHRNGWNAGRAQAYMAMDDRAGFVRHAEVYRRKKLRAEAVKRYAGERASGMA